MPRTRASAADTKSEPEKPVETEEQIDFEGDNEEEEEIEYEEVEEEVEMEEEEEEEVEEEVEEEEEEEEENESDGSDEEKMKVDAEDVEKKHAELLALPPHGSEVYIGGITQDVSEAAVREFCETIGEVTEVRIMKGKDTTQNKGYAFVTYRNKELASNAIKELNNTELKGKRVKCSEAQAKHRLFIGNVPRNWGEEDMRTAVTNVGPGVITVELVKDPQNSGRNRGFAFIEYYNNACAEYSRQKMSNSDFKLDDNAPTVSWADPKNAETAASSQVKAVYVKNLPKQINQDRLKELFEHHGKITKVVLPPAKPGQEQSRYGFVHFAERSSAMKALKNTEKYEIDGKILECSLAKPQADQKSSGGSSSQKGPTLPTYPPRIGYGMMGAPYGALGAGYGGPGVGQPMVYGRGATPAGLPGGLAMMPMLLPDGRIGYVLQQPGLMHSPPPASRGGRSGGGGGSSGGRRGDNGGLGRSRYNPY
ncbi:hypothetical protein K7X08_015592 [Anisodus acutangulus]|uniref:RRM domain-containing protein n=1 Tax=Anisodus acutangulus TaxID=402998 RepID=A0A9Q1R0J1_9SOLA|nr:hypothetical protein K7X08_015592 [Anisodus acutangulus]